MLCCFSSLKQTTKSKSEKMGGPENRGQNPTQNNFRITTVSRLGEVEKATKTKGQTNIDNKKTRTKRTCCSLENEEARTKDENMVASHFATDLGQLIIARPFWHSLSIPLEFLFRTHKTKHIQLPKLIRLE